ncbi:MAG: hypothetical protein ACR2LN_03185 [Candidatus Levyibacteriota bacterium]
MEYLKSFLQKEKSHFNRLDRQAQKLLGSITLYYFIGPIFGIFIDAFIWRQSHDPILVSFYNIILFIGIPIGFYLNGLLLRKYTPNILQFVGLFVGGLVVAILIFLPKLSYTSVMIYGLIDGIAGGLYWANRNLLTLKTTTSENRIYFSGIESIINTYSKILIPVLIGWFLILGTKTHLYSTIQGYKVIGVIMMFVICMAGFVMMTLRIKHASYQQLLLKTVSENWKKFRLLQIVLGFMQGITSVLPTLMVLILLGKEDTLGTIQSLSSILTAIVVYFLAKRLKVQHRVRLLEISFVLGLIGAVSFSIFYSGLGVLIFYAAQAIMQPFIWMATSSINYDLIDEDKNNETHYAYISDQELYLNGGRIAAITLFVIFIQLFSNETALRYTPLLFAFAQIFMQLLARSIDKKAS